MLSTMFTTMVSSLMVLLLTITTPHVTAADTGVVHTLTDANFTDFVKVGSHLIEFYAPWCTHCKALEPAYTAAAEQIDPGMLRLSKVDCVTNTKVCGAHSITGYPTIKYKTARSKFKEYGDGRDTDDFVAFAQLLTKPAIQSVLNKQSINTLTSDNSILFVLFNDNRVNPVFDSIAHHNYPATAIRFATAPLNLLSQYVSTDSLNERLVAVSAGRTQYPSMPMSGADEAQVTAFVEANKLPLVATMGADVFDNVMASKKLIVEIIVETDDSTKQMNNQKFVNSLYPVAEKHHDKFVFLLVDANRYGGYVGQYGVDRRTLLPSVLAIDHPSYYWKPNQIPELNITKQLSPAQVDMFLTSISNGTLFAQNIEPAYSPYRYTSYVRYYYNHAPAPVQYLCWLIGASIFAYSAYKVLYNIYLTFKEEYDAASDEPARKRRPVVVETKKTK